MKIGIFSVLYIVPAGTVIACSLYEAASLARCSPPVFVLYLQSSSPFSPSFCISSSICFLFVDQLSPSAGRDLCSAPTARPTQASQTSRYGSDFDDTALSPFSILFSVFLPCCISGSDAQALHGLGRRHYLRLLGAE